MIHRLIDFCEVLAVTLIIAAMFVYSVGLFVAEEHIDSYNRCVSSPNVAGADCR